MLHALPPKSLIVLSIAIVHDSKSIFFAIDVFAFVEVAIRPRVLSFSMLLIVLPFAFVHLSVIALHHCKAIEFIICKTALEDTSSLHQHSSPVLFVVQELAVVPRIVVVHGFSLSIRQVVLPLPLVCVPRSINVPTVSICHIVLYIALIVASILLYQSSLSLATSVHKLPLQIISVFKGNRASAVGQAVGELAFVLGIQMFEKLALGFFCEAGPACLRDGGKLVETRLDVVGEIGMLFFECARTHVDPRVGSASVEAGLLKFLKGRLRLELGDLIEWRRTVGLLAKLLPHLIDIITIAQR